MRRNIELGGQKIDYELKISNRIRKIRFAIYSGGRFIITVPRFYSELDLPRLISIKTEWILDKIAEFKNIKEKIFLPSGRFEYLANRGKALLIARDRIRYYNTIYNFSINKIRIKDQKSLWGSCSKKGNLNFNYKLVFLSEKAADYLVVHELCHLKEFNHSKKFWKLVELAIPDYSLARSELKQYNLR